MRQAQTWVTSSCEGDAQNDPPQCSAFIPISWEGGHYVTKRMEVNTIIMFRNIVLADLEWKIIYVGSASSESHDQTLDSVLVGPVPAGRHKFVFQAEAPNSSKLPPEDAVGVTVVLLTCSYKKAEFVRVGFYVNNEYCDPEMAEEPPVKPIFEKVSDSC